MPVTMAKEITFQLPFAVLPSTGRDPVSWPPSPSVELLKGFLFLDMANHTFTGVFIPAKIWVSKDLIPQEKMMLAEIKALSEDTGWCFAGNKHFADWLVCGTSNISNYIQRFQREGMIEVTYKDKKTFSGRRMRVNLEWFHGLSTPYTANESPYTANVPPYTGNEAPYTGNVTETQIKSTFKPNESSDAPAESESVKAEEVKRGVVAPPAEAAAPFVMPKRVDTVDEAEAIIMEWAKSDGRESVRKWYADAARPCTEADVKEMVAKFSGVYLTVSDEGKRQRMAQDPLQFFKYTFKIFLKNEIVFLKKYIPGASSQQAPTRVTVSATQTQTRY
jgi:hypothetical protein